MENVVIVGAARTPIGSFNGALSSYSASDLGVVAIKEALKRANVQALDVDEVVMGQILTAGTGQNPARQCAIKSGIPIDSTAYVINQLCGSGLRAVALGAQAIRLGDARIVVAGGQENMSASPHLLQVRKGIKLGSREIYDSMIKDGLWDAFNEYHMGNTAENVATKWGISRNDQDLFALNSQKKAQIAQKSGRFIEEIAPVEMQSAKGGFLINCDEYPKHETTYENLKCMKPVFLTEHGTVTAGNSSGINDGAAALVLMSEKQAKKQSHDILATIKTCATVGVEPAIMGSGPIPASRMALKKANWEINELDLIEANEAFAAQACAVNKDLGWDISKVNVNGGAIALGHPIGASGARILVTLLYEMKKRDAKKGIATLCIGGGMGIAMCIERY